jgi:hypothetical protein
MSMLEHRGRRRHITRRPSYELTHPNVDRSIRHHNRLGFVAAGSAAVDGVTNNPQAGGAINTGVVHGGEIIQFVNNHALPLDARTITGMAIGATVAPLVNSIQAASDENYLLDKGLTVLPRDTLGHKTGEIAIKGVIFLASLYGANRFAAHTPELLTDASAAGVWVGGRLVLNYMRSRVNRIKKEAAKKIGKKVEKRKKPDTERREPEESGRRDWGGDEKRSGTGERRSPDVDYE